MLIVVTLGEDGLTGTETLGQKDHQLDDKSDRAGNTTVGGRENTIVTCVFSCALSCLVQLSCSSMSLVLTYKTQIEIRAESREHCSDQVEGPVAGHQQQPEVRDDGHQLQGGRGEGGGAAQSDLGRVELVIL